MTKSHAFDKKPLYKKTLNYFYKGGRIEDLIYELDGNLRDMNENIFIEGPQDTGKTSLITYELWKLKKEDPEIFDFYDEYYVCTGDELEYNLAYEMCQIIINQLSKIIDIYEDKILQTWGKNVKKWFSSQVKGDKPELEKMKKDLKDGKEFGFQMLNCGLNFSSYNEKNDSIRISIDNVREALIEDIKVFQRVARDKRPDLERVYIVFDDVQKLLYPYIQARLRKETENESKYRKQITDLFSLIRAVWHNSSRVFPDDKVFVELIFISSRSDLYELSEILGSNEDECFYLEILDKSDMFHDYNDVFCEPLIVKPLRPIALKDLISYRMKIDRDEEIDDISFEQITPEEDGLDLLVNYCDGNLTDLIKSCNTAYSQCKREERERTIINQSAVLRTLRKYLIPELTDKIGSIKVGQWKQKKTIARENCGKAIDFLKEKTDLKLRGDEDGKLIKIIMHTLLVFYIHGKLNECYINLGGEPSRFPKITSSIFEKNYIKDIISKTTGTWPKLFIDSNFPAKLRPIIRFLKGKTSDRSLVKKPLIKANIQGGDSLTMLGKLFIDSVIIKEWDNVYSGITDPERMNNNLINGFDSSQSVLEYMKDKKEIKKDINKKESDKEILERRVKEKEIDILLDKFCPNCGSNETTSFPDLLISKFQKRYPTAPIINYNYICKKCYFGFNSNDGSKQKRCFKKKDEYDGRKKTCKNCEQRIACYSFYT